jgi:hypothetical protein
MDDTRTVSDDRRTDSEGRVLKLFVRMESQLGTEQVKKAVVDEVRRLERRGVVDDYEVVPWGKTFRQDGALAGTEYHETVRRHVAEFEEWAREHDVSLEHTFERNRLRSTITGESFSVVSLPVVCLAEYVDGELAGIYPCRTGDRVCDVREFLSQSQREPGELAPSSV